MRVVGLVLVLLAIGCGDDTDAPDPHERVPCGFQNPAYVTCDLACTGMTQALEDMGCLDTEGRSLPETFAFGDSRGACFPTYDATNTANGMAFDECQ